MRLRRIVQVFVLVVCALPVVLGGQGAAPVEWIRSNAIRLTTPEAGR
jgi:hypothetical protein